MTWQQMTIELDMGGCVGVTEDQIRDEVMEWLQDEQYGPGMNLLEVEFHVRDLRGPAGGAPVVEFIASVANVLRIATAYDGGNGEVEHLMSFAELISA